MRWNDERQGGRRRRPLEQGGVADGAAKGRSSMGTHTSLAWMKWGHALSEIVIGRRGRLENEPADVEVQTPGADVLQLGRQGERVAIVTHKSLIGHAPHRPREEGRGAADEQAVGGGLDDSIAVFAAVVDGVVRAHLQTAQMIVVEESGGGEMGGAGRDEDRVEVGLTGGHPQTKCPPVRKEVRIQESWSGGAAGSHPCQCVRCGRW